jgi:hypothetical protein
METPLTRWRYNAKLRRWYHPTSASSDNGPDDPPAEIEGNGRSSAAGGVTRPLRQSPPCSPCRESRRESTPKESKLEESWPEHHDRPTEHNRRTEHGVR